MKVFVLSFVLLASLAVVIRGATEQRREKEFRYYNADDASELGDVNRKGMAASSKHSDSSGRMFMSKFFFNKMFGKQQSQPIPPIIIITSRPDTSPKPVPPTDIDIDKEVPLTTDTDSELPDIDTDTTEAETSTASPASPPDGTRRVQYYGRGYNDEDYEETDIIDDQTLANALFSASNEYMVTDRKTMDTASAKGNRDPARSSNSNEFIWLRIPKNYIGYFKNGQRVILNTNKTNQPVKRRVNKKRRNRRRSNKNKSKGPRFIAP